MNGCVNLTRCFVSTPYRIQDEKFIWRAAAANFSDESLDNILGLQTTRNHDTHILITGTWARWALSPTEVPEPYIIYLFIISFVYLVIKRYKY